MHVAILMDGSDRWAARRGLKRAAGYRAGIQAAQRIVAAAPGFGIDTLTLVPFSARTWARPPADVVRSLLVFLMQMPAMHAERGVRCTILGRRDRLPAAVAAAAQRAEAATAAGGGLRLRLALDASARAGMAAAAGALDGEVAEASFAALLLPPGAAPGDAEVDLLIRTGGRQRLADSLLWECAYAELHFTACAWPDFGVADLEAALADFARRERRFGAVGTACGRERAG